MHVHVFLGLPEIWTHVGCIVATEVPAHSNGYQLFCRALKHDKRAGRLAAAEQQLAEVRQQLLEATGLQSEAEQQLAEARKQVSV